MDDTKKKVITEYCRGRKLGFDVCDCKNECEAPLLDVTTLGDYNNGRLNYVIDESEIYGISKCIRDEKTDKDNRADGQ